VLALTTTLVISRALRVAVLGRWRFAQAATSCLLAFSDAGLTSLAIREIAKNPRKTGAFAVPMEAIQVLGAGLLYGALALLPLNGPLPPDTNADRPATWSYGLSAGTEPGASPAGA
jgi:O-antigen/teichoic acid export membrane protein